MNIKSASEIDLIHLRKWIGQPSIAIDVVGSGIAEKYHATFDHKDPPPQAGECVPPLFHFCMAQPAAPTASLGLDGHPGRGGFLPPVPLPRRMWAGGSLTFHKPLNVGDQIRRTSSVSDVALKEGRAGPLCFVTVEHRIEANSVLAIEERQDIVYRGFDPSPRQTSTSPAAAAKGEYVRPIKVGATHLFRYSALTFNSHRIHYDREYAVEVEGYPGLVVHGPFQAALLADFAVEIKGRRPARFKFRGVSPLFDDDAFSLNAASDGSGLKFWTEKEDGTVCMTAEAHWS